jgi:hypothetical protein
MSINKQEKRKGNLFQRGFKRKIIDNQKYFYSAVYYIHANPVHHGILKEFIEYDYSSYNLLLQKDNKKLCCEEVIDWFGGRQNYIDFHKKAYNKNLSDNYLIED